MPILTTSLATGLAGILTLGSSPIAAPDAPVTVVSCDYTSQWLPSSSTGIPESASFQGGNLRISFINQAPLTATGVRFAVRYGGRTQIIDDAGTFSTGTPIVQDFTPPASANAFGSESAQCAVEAVTFSDGSTWQPA
ncbi:MAG: hypothetical protein M3169_14840 [Candidatus Eremiobacteraeota bacterium]|nr:hypothetical protein [Candidatus Eremiobacteraeota bacterium]